ncbi:LANO_0E11804g1_1 [Lachancea nothofagi CBS 11611]|uniref:LANO_0E11804g1_1 n=1 Tax=Lachancea nothofagi CBS 11611 TaxID=1266666 RepID=A0A1G4JXT6_9SACH|nr:LANO_0E11804g1_1 [Lachancea nothofagi CBS 11611]
MTNMETGMLDVGTHCAFCRQLDFLPFHCKHCDGDFCGTHRTPQTHRCKKWRESDQEQDEDREPGKAPTNSNGKYFASLLPEKGHVRVQQASQPKPQAPLANLSVRDRLEAAGQGSALAKLKSFFGRRTAKSQSTSRRSAKSGPAQRLIEIAQLKKTAKGDPNIPLPNRVYVYCYVVESRDENLRHELFVNKLWPVGRALDSIAHLLDVPNKNAQDLSSTGDKLFLYRDNNGMPHPLDPSSRVVSAINDVDVLFLVRGQQFPKSSIASSV